MSRKNWFTSWVKAPKGARHPRHEAEPGQLWGHSNDVDEDGNPIFTCVALVVGELQPSVGNYPMVMLDSWSYWKTNPGDRFNAAVTTARGWRRLAV